MFFKNLEIFFNELNSTPVVDEWYMSDFTDKYIKILESYEAFEILKEFIPYMIEKYNHDFEYELTEVLRALKNQANTNEIFYSLEEKNKILSLYVDDYNLSTLNEILK